MRGKYRPHHILEVVLLFIALAGFSASNSKANENSKYLDAVREFADNVLKYGRDTYGPKHTPLFVDGLNIHTHEPVKWISPEGERWVLSNLASQQNLFRTLDGLTKITGDPKYRQAAMKAIEYAFANLRSPNGLLYWGGTVAYDAQADQICGSNHDYLKAFYPYYELMWSVDSKATEQLIESMWASHVLDWSNLDMDRIGPLDRLSVSKGWDHEYKGGPVFLESGSGGSFFNTGTDLIYAATWLTKVSGEKGPLGWAKRLAKRYVDTRHPNTGISYLMYTEPSFVVRESYDDVLRKLVPGTTEFLPDIFMRCSNPIFRKSTVGYYMSSPGIFIHTRVFFWQSLFLVGEILDGEGNEFRQWALEELTAFGKASYRSRDNVYVPILTDGTNLEGYVVREDGPLGPKGVALEPLLAEPSDFWAYTMGYRVTGDEFMREMARNISKGNGFGDIGLTLEVEPQINIQTDCSDPYALLGFLELYKKTSKSVFLGMAEKIGDNILSSRFYKGFFVASNKHIYTKFDAIDCLVLLHLHVSLGERVPTISKVWPGRSFFQARYRKKDIVTDNQIIYTLTESTEPPMSLQEAAAVGDIDLVKSIIDKGAEVNGREDHSLRTALHRAAISGYKDVAELLLGNGASFNVRDTWPGGTPLHYAAEKDHREIVELLIAKGADIDAQREYPVGDRPLHSAVRAGHKEIAELLIAKGADINAMKASGDTPLHSAAGAGYKNLAELLIANGADVNAKNNDGQTPIDIALSRNRKDFVELLIAKGATISSIYVAARMGDVAGAKTLIEQGADVNAQDDKGTTPLHYAVQGGHKELAELLITKGAHVNGKDKYGYTPLNYASWYENKDIIKLLVAKGADVNLKPEKDYPPLHYAVWNEDLDMVKLFVAQGAKFDVKDQDGWTAFRYAAAQGNRDIVEFFISKGADASSFHMAAYMGDLTRLKLFVKQGDDVDTKDELGWTPLYWAASTGQENVAEFLIANGADVNAKTNDSSTTLYQAAATGGLNFVQLLIAKGADVNAKDKYGNTPLHSAASSGRREVVELLISEGAIVDVKGRNGRTPLYYAVLKGHKDIVEILVAKGADIDAKDKSHRTALHMTAMRDRKDMAELLIEKGANVNVKDENDQTALHLSVRQGRRDMVELLINKGADANARNKWNRTPLDIAVDQGHTEIVELLRKHGAKE